MYIDIHTYIHTYSKRTLFHYKQIRTCRYPDIYDEMFVGMKLTEGETKNLAAIASCVHVKNALRNRNFKEERYFMARYYT